jgi:serine/threonine protein phosphatase PrpC
MEKSPVAEVNSRSPSNPLKRSLAPGTDYTKQKFSRSTSSLPSWRSKSCKEIHVGELHIVLRYGEHSIKGKRRTQEDAHTATTDVEKRSAEEENRDPDPNVNPAFFAIYDGHGGSRCSDFAAQNLHRYFIQERKAEKVEVQEGLRRAIARVEKEWSDRAEKEDLVDGTTACIVIIDEDRLCVANVGDSEAVLCRGGKPFALCEVHNPAKNPKETLRVLAAGGSVRQERVVHPRAAGAFSLAVSRAIGDLPFKHPEFTGGKPSGVIAEPEFIQLQLTREDEFIVIACDGLWDVMTKEEVVEFCSKRLSEANDPQTAAQDLVDRAFALGSLDNISVLVVALKQFDTSSAPPLASSGSTQSV